MYAVFTEGRLTFLGEHRDKALAVFNSKPNSTLHAVDDQDELDELLGNAPETTSLTDGFKELVRKLDDLDLTGKLQESSSKLVGEVKSLGIKSMKTVGEGFVALGELLRKSDEDEEECGHGACCRHAEEDEK